jgi:nitrogen fixation protein NifU and related proteins
MSMQSLYQELILQHYRSPKNRGTLEEPDVEISMNNPVCGDEITLQLRVAEGSVAEARFSGQGCSISQASASMMTERLKGRSLEDARRLSARFLELMHGSSEAAADPLLGDLRALAGVAKFPVRVKCALLAWNALDEADKALESRSPQM